MLFCFNNIDVEEFIEDGDNETFRTDGRGFIVD